MSMGTVGIKTLKNDLSAYVRRAAKGEHILVTDRDRVVAELVPPGKPSGTDEEFFARGKREGWLSPASEAGTPLLGLKPVRGVSFEQLMKELAADREDR